MLKNLKMILDDFVKKEPLNTESINLKLEPTALNTCKGSCISGPHEHLNPLEAICNPCLEECMSSVQGGLSKITSDIAVKKKQETKKRVTNVSNLAPDQDRALGPILRNCRKELGKAAPLTMYLMNLEKNLSVMEKVLKSTSRLSQSANHDKLSLRYTGILEEPVLEKAGELLTCVLTHTSKWEAVNGGMVISGRTMLSLMTIAETCAHLVSCFDSLIATLAASNLKEEVANLLPKEYLLLRQSLLNLPGMEEVMKISDSCLEESNMLLSLSKEGVKKGFDTEMELNLAPSVCKRVREYDEIIDEDGNCYSNGVDADEINSFIERQRQREWDLLCDEHYKNACKNSNIW